VSVPSNKPLKRMVGRRRPPTAERQDVRQTRPCRSQALPGSRK
jgi:hypothetical protein